MKIKFKIFSVLLIPALLFEFSQGNISHADPPLFTAKISRDSAGKISSFSDETGPQFSLELNEIDYFNEKVFYEIPYDSSIFYRTSPNCIKNHNTDCLSGDWQGSGVSFSVNFTEKLKDSDSYTFNVTFKNEDGDILQEIPLTLTKTDINNLFTESSPSNQTTYTSSTTNQQSGNNIAQPTGTGSSQASSVPSSTCTPIYGSALGTNCDTQNQIGTTTTPSSFTMPDGGFTVQLIRDLHCDNVTDGSTCNESGFVESFRQFSPDAQFFSDFQNFGIVTITPNGSILSPGENDGDAFADYWKFRDIHNLSNNTVVMPEDGFTIQLIRDMSCDTITDGSACNESGFVEAFSLFPADAQFFSTFQSFGVVVITPNGDVLGARESNDGDDFSDYWEFLDNINTTPPPEIAPPTASSFSIQSIRDFSCDNSGVDQNACNAVGFVESFSEFLGDDTFYTSFQSMGPVVIKQDGTIFSPGENDNDEFADFWTEVDLTVPEDDDQTVLQSLDTSTQNLAPNEMPCDHNDSMKTCFNTLSLTRQQINNASFPTGSANFNNIHVLPFRRLNTTTNIEIKTDSSVPSNTFTISVSPESGYINDACKNMGSTVSVSLNCLDSSYPIGTNLYVVIKSNQANGIYTTKTY